MSMPIPTAPTDGATLPPVHLRSEDPDATAALGAMLADLLVAGDVLVLTGPLGAGKTRLVQGVAAGLGVQGRVTSPTFVLVRRHEGRIPLVHVDAYRLADARDLATLDDDVLDPDVVTCVEWGDVVRDALPAVRLELELRVDGDHGDAPRAIVLVPIGAGWSGRVATLTRRCHELSATTPGLTALGTAPAPASAPGAAGAGR
jgi:tRNA threonylcarbamoyladenosine biosynthesis protein TsaE